MPKYKIVLDNSESCDEDDEDDEDDNYKYNRYRKSSNSNDNSTITFVVLIILIIFVIICLFYVFRTNNNSKNSFVSANATRDYKILTDIFNAQGSNAKYSEIKAQVPGMDPVKHRQITDNFNRGTLNANFIDSL